MTVDKLPDVALLEIFDFYMDEAWREVWHTLVHVCRKWRNIVFESPRRLDLRLYCNARTPVRETLDVWPLLPIVIRGNGHKIWGMGNIIAALEHNDRICELDIFDAPSSQMKVLAAMQRPFPALTSLQLGFERQTAPVDPGSFLGGSASRLRSLSLDYMPFPGLPKLLLSATHLVHLKLRRIPGSGYISPEALVSCLSVLTSLESLNIGFKSPLCRPDLGGRRPPPRTRTLLPVLTELFFEGVSEYLEDFLARIDGPLLDKLDIAFFHQLKFDTPQITQFISRAPNFNTCNEARVEFSNWGVYITFPQIFYGGLILNVSCRPSDWQLSCLAQVCSSSFPRALLPAVERLYILEAGLTQLDWQDDIENGQWLELLHSFTAVTGLYISREFAPRIAPSLQELVGERVTEVLPALRTLYFEGPGSLPSGPVQEAIGQFVAARQLVSHPVAVSRWGRKEL